MPPTSLLPANEPTRELLLALFEQAPGFIALLSGPRHVVEFANPAYYGLIGHREVLGQAIEDALPEVVEQGFVDLLDRVYATGEPFAGRGVPVRFQATPGGDVDERFVDFVYQPMRAADGRVTGVFLQGNDVTESVRLAAARAADAAHARGLVAELESLYHAAPVALTALRRGPDGRYRYHRSNDAHARMHGTTPEALSGRALDDTVTPALAARLTALFDRVVGSGETLMNVEVEGETTGVGEARNWMANYYPIAGAHGAERSVGVVALDVTAQRRAEEALRMSATRATYVSTLADALRPLTDTEAIQATASRLLGEHLGVSRAYYAETDPDDAHAVIAGEYLDRVGSIAGRYRLDDFGPALIATLRSGRPVVIDDLTRETTLSEAEHAAFAALNVASVVAVGLHKDGRMAGIVIAQFEHPHAWTSAELEIVSETAERTWSAIGQARTEAVLREREARYRALFTSIDEGYCLCEIVTDEAGEAVDYRFLEVNPLFETMTGLAGAVGHTILSLVPDIERHWVDTYARVAFGGESLRFEQESEVMGRIFNVFATPVEPRGRFALVFADVTDRRRAETALHESEENLRHALEGGEMGVWSWDLATNAVTADARLRTIWGFAPDAALTAAEFFARVHPRDVARLEADIRDAMASLGTYRTEFRLQLPDEQGGGVRWLAGPGRAVVGSGVDGVATRLVGVNFDVTERREGEEALRRREAELSALTATLEARVAARTVELEGANAQLELANRELNDFAYVASHDLQEPLRKIQSFAGLLVAEHADTLGEDGRHSLERVQNAAARMSTLIRDLLALSRVSTSAARIEPVDLDATLASVLVDLDVRIAQTKGTVESAPLGTVAADPLQMRQLFQNLIGNALKFHRENVPPTVRVRADRTRGNVTVVVEDDGVGFEARYAERIFAPFQRLHAKSAYEGTGMGLAIVRRIAERHGGTASATSTPGEGARFAVTLPQG